MTDLSTKTTRKQHPAYLSEGGDSVVYIINHKGKDYAVRIAKFRGLQASVIDDNLGGAVLGKNVPHLEQIVAASYEPGVTVAEIMPGKQLGDMTIDDMKGVTDEQLAELVDTATIASERGIVIDDKPSNVLYDVKLGFGIIDYRSLKKAGVRTGNNDVGTVVGLMSEIIRKAAFEDKPYNRTKTTDDYAHELDLYNESVNLLGRYRAIVTSKLQGADLQKALGLIDATVAFTQPTIADHSNPEWVAKKVAQ